MSLEFDPGQPYNTLPPLPPPCEVETKPVLKAVIAAREALAELNTACRLIPNPAIITQTIPLREAQASSEIENIVTTNDELFRAVWQVDTEVTPAVREALRYNYALHKGVESLSRPLSLKTAQLVCQLICDSPGLIRSTPGTYIGDPLQGSKVYTPPEGYDVILEKISAWERFLYGNHDLDGLVMMALAHYQFEAIHPFYDGNGRTGRILNILYLIQENILTLPVLYLSGYIVENKTEYYRLLRAVTAEQAWVDWILFMVNGVEVTARAATQLIDDLRTTQDETEEKIKTIGRIGPAKELAELLFVHPYIRISNVVDSGLAKRQTVSQWLQSLAAAGVLEEEQVGRNKVFINKMALSVLTRA